MQIISKDIVNIVKWEFIVFNITAGYCVFNWDRDATDYPSTQINNNYVN